MSLIMNTKNIVVHHNHATENTNALFAKLKYFYLETGGIYIYIYIYMCVYIYIYIYIILSLDGSFFMMEEINKVILPALCV